MAPDRTTSGPRPHHEWPPRPRLFPQLTGPRTRDRWTPVKRIFNIELIAVLGSEVPADKVVGRLCGTEVFEDYDPDGSFEAPRCN